ncbi:hypothetical protein [Psychrobacillus soli]|uniref:hypothetical protein n=1 Tax=Psychrobacillus soli TaxID=1543965 RepID=UPI001FEB6254|nr:hypothetical protein [Psychrobacillus soli]
MTRQNGTRYTQERKTEIIGRMMPPNNEAVVQISKEECISEVTLYKWRKEARIAGTATPGNGQTSDKWNSQDKFLIVMGTFAMNELEIAEYCRKKGLDWEQIEAWKLVCLQANGQAFDQSKQLNVQLKEEQKYAKALEKGLQKRRKHWRKLWHYYFLEKRPSDLGRRGGRMIDPANRTLAVKLIANQMVYD